MASAFARVDASITLTGDVTQVFMCWWDSEFIRRMEEAGLDVILYKRLVDDVNLVLKRLGVAREEMGDGPEDEKNMRMVQQYSQRDTQVRTSPSRSLQTTPLGM